MPVRDSYFRRRAMVTVLATVLVYFVCALGQRHTCVCLSVECVFDIGCYCHAVPDRPAITFAVDWALNNNDLSGPDGASWWSSFCSL